MVVLQKSPRIGIHRKITVLPPVSHSFKAWSSVFWSHCVLFLELGWFSYEGLNLDFCLFYLCLHLPSHYFSWECYLPSFHNIMGRLMRRLMGKWGTEAIMGRVWETSRTQARLQSSRSHSCHPTSRTVPKDHMRKWLGRFISYTMQAQA